MPTFSWSTDAHGGARALRVDISQYVSGDGKWMHDALPVTGGAYYVFSDWYRSDRSSAVSVYYETASDLWGEGRWANLFSGLPPASSWTPYRTGFHMPAGAVRAVFAHYIEGNGYLLTDDYSVQQLPAPPGFSQPLVSLTFDDGSQAFYDIARPVLSARGMVTTQYVPTQGMTRNDPFMMTSDELRALRAAGHEIGSHTVSHPDLTTVSARELQREVESSRTYLQGVLGTEDVVSLAYPFGSYDARVISAAQAAGYRSGRSVEEGYNSKVGIEPFDIRVQNITSTTTLAEFQSWVDYARMNRYWLVIVYHEVVPDSAPVCTDPPVTSPCLGPWDTRYSSFVQQLDYLVAQGMAGNVRTVSSAYAIVERERHTPSAGNVALSPTAPGSDDTLTAAPQGFADPDGDALSYRYVWSVNGGPVAGATGAAFDLAQPGHGDAGDTVTVTVAAFDPAGNESGPALATVTVAAPPAGGTTPGGGGGSGSGGSGSGGSSPSCRVADKTGPRIAIASPTGRVYRTRRVRFRFSARDGSGVASLSARLRLPSGRLRTVHNGALLRLTRAGRYRLRVGAVDRCAHRSARTVQFRVSR